MGLGRHVEVLRAPTDQEVAHAAADEVCLEAAAHQPTDDAQRVRIEVFTARQSHVDDQGAAFVAATRAQDVDGGRFAQASRRGPGVHVVVGGFGAARTADRVALLAAAGHLVEATCILARVRVAVVGIALGARASTPRARAFVAFRRALAGCRAGGTFARPGLRRLAFVVAVAARGTRCVVVFGGASAFASAVVVARLAPPHAGRAIGRFGRSRFTLTRFTYTRFTLTRFALARFTFTRFALARFTFTRFTFARFAFARFAFARFALTRCAFAPLVSVGGAAASVLGTGASQSTAPRGRAAFVPHFGPVALVAAVFVASALGAPVDALCVARARAASGRAVAIGLVAPVRVPVGLPVVRTPGAGGRLRLRLRRLAPTSAAALTGPGGTGLAVDAVALAARETVAIAVDLALASRSRAPFAIVAAIVAAPHGSVAVARGPIISGTMIGGRARGGTPLGSAIVGRFEALMAHGRFSAIDRSGP
ncbi:hypothetical protein [Rohdeia mirabilis]|uniref:hypothetical protein n=1 Tax=Rohdeia mirabilis TaxID=2528008 RepID=UPI003AF335AB